ncbi:MAG: hemolysin family protein [bacterium]
MSYLIPETILLLVLLWLSSLFSSSETAYLSLKPQQVRGMKGKHSKKSIKVARVISNPQRFLISILIGNTFVNVAASSVGTNIIRNLVSGPVITISVIAMAGLILTFGEIIPKVAAVNKPQSIALGNVGAIEIAMQAISPLRAVLEKITSAMVVMVFGKDVASVSKGKEIGEAILISQEEGVLDRSEAEMLAGILRLRSLTAQNIMTPRTDVFMLSASLRIADAIALVKSSNFSRVPIFKDERRDHIVGILYTKDLLRNDIDQEADLASIARKPLFVPESKNLVSLMQDFMSNKVHIAIVVDEHGSMAGLVTFDDILSEITGRDMDQYMMQHHFKRLGRGEWEVSARMELECFNALTGLPLVDSNAETVAGYVLNRLGRIPKAGETIEVGNLGFKVIDADSRRLITLRVKRLGG